MLGVSFGCRSEETAEAEPSAGSIDKLDLEPASPALMVFEESSGVIEWFLSKGFALSCRLFFFLLRVGSAEGVVLGDSWSPTFIARAEDSEERLRRRQVDPEQRIKRVRRAWIVWGVESLDQPWSDERFAGDGLADLPAVETARSMAQAGNRTKQRAD